MCEPTAIVTGAGVLLNYFAGNQAADDAAAAQRKADALTADQLAFQKQQYADWQEVYGPIQDNLSSFFQGLTPETFTASGLTQLENQHNANMKRLETSFAQRGIDSAAQDFMRQNASLDLAESKAKLRHSAPLKLAEAQSNFLAAGTGNPNASGVSNALGNAAAQQQGLANNLTATSSAAYGTAGQLLQSGIADYVAKSKTKVPGKTTKVAKTTPNTIGGLTMVNSLPEE